MVSQMRRWMVSGGSHRPRSWQFSSKGYLPGIIAADQALGGRFFLRQLVQAAGSGGRLSGFFPGFRQNQRVGGADRGVPRFARRRCGGRRRRDAPLRRLAMAWAWAKASFTRSVANILPTPAAPRLGLLQCKVFGVPYIICGFVDSPFYFGLLIKQTQIKTVAVQVRLTGVIAPGQGSQPPVGLG